MLEKHNYVHFAPGRPRSGVLYDERSVKEMYSIISIRKGEGLKDNTYRNVMKIFMKTTHVSNLEVPANMFLKLLVNGNFVSDQEALMSIWASHFEAQGKSQVFKLLPQGSGHESA